MNKKGQFGFLLIIFIVFIILGGLYLGYINKPSVGDCVDVGKYDDITKDKYCEVTGVGSRVAIYKFKPTEWSMYLESGCSVRLCDYSNGVITSNCPSYPLDMVNTIDAQKVDKRLCEG